jgi:hypothetical protein
VKGLTLERIKSPTTIIGTLLDTLGDTFKLPINSDGKDLRSLATDVIAVVTDWFYQARDILNHIMCAEITNFALFMFMSGQGEASVAEFNGSKQHGDAVDYRDATLFANIFDPELKTITLFKELDVDNVDHQTILKGRLKALDIQLKDELDQFDLIVSALTYMNTLANQGTYTVSQIETSLKKVQGLKQKMVSKTCFAPAYPNANYFYDAAARRITRKDDSNAGVDWDNLLVQESPTAAVFNRENHMQVTNATGKMEVQTIQYVYFDNIIRIIVNYLLVEKMRTKIIEAVAKYIMETPAFVNPLHRAMQIIGLYNTIVEGDANKIDLAQARTYFSRIANTRSVAV